MERFLQREKAGGFPMVWRVLGRILLVVGLGYPIYSYGETEAVSVSSKMLKAVDLGDLVSSEARRMDHQPGSGTSARTVVRKEVSEEFRFFLKESDLLEALHREIIRRYDLAGDLRLSLEKPWVDVRVEHPDWEWVISGLPQQGIRNRFLATVELRSEGRRIAEWHLGIRAELRQPVLVAIRRVERLSPLGQDMFETRDWDVLALMSSPVESGESIGLMQNMRTLESGQILLWKDLRDRPLVTRNQLVEVVASEGLMRVVMKGRAMEDGAMGQVIRIRNQQTRNDFQAEVSGVNQAVVRF